MRLIPLAVSLVVGPTPAQNLFEIYSGCTNFTSRGTLGANPGEILLQVPGTHFSGVCQDSSGGSAGMLAFVCVTQDQNAATQETYSLLIRGDASGAPDCSAAGGLLRAGPLTTPPGSGTLAWYLTFTLGTPAAVVPLCSTFYVGAEVAAAPQWTSDGQSFHIATYYLSSGSQGDNPAANAPNVAWNCTATGVSRQPQVPRVIRCGLLTASAVLNTGNVDPTVGTTNCIYPQGQRSWGAGGLWPACAGSGGTRNDGIDIRVRDAANGGGFFLVFVGDLICPGVPLPGLASGGLYLDPAHLTHVLTAALDRYGEGIATVLPPGNLSCVPVVNSVVHFQGFTAGATMSLPGNLTNRAGVSYLPQ